MNVTLQLAALDSYNGFRELGDNGNPFGPWQGVGNGFAWCDSCAQWGACEGGGFRWYDGARFGYKGNAYCPGTINEAEAMGLYVAANFSPIDLKPGHQVLFSWNRNIWADHIGTFVRFLANGNLLVFEGNHNDMAGYVERDWTYVLGAVALPQDTDVPGDPLPPVDTGNGSQEPPAFGGRYLRYPPLTSGDDVRTWQEHMAWRGWSIAVDGQFGRGSRQVCRGFQANKGLEVDGIVGPQTWAATWTEPVT